MSPPPKLLSLALVSVLFASCGKNGSDQEPPPRPVKAMQVGDTSSIDKAVLSGKAKATQELNIAFEVSGRIVEFPVSVGDIVDESQVLALLDPRDLQNAVSVAEAEKERSEALLSRTQKAFESNAVSAQDVTNAEALARASAAALKIAEKQLADATIRAPFKGRVAATYVENYENVIAKQKILRLIDLSKIEMVVNVPENLIPNVQYVESIEVTFSPFPDTKISATVKEVGSEASELTRTYPVTIIMDQPEGIEILPGMAGEAIGKATLPPERLAEGIPILYSALVSAGEGESFVWSIEKSSDGTAGTVKKTPVEVNRFSPSGLVITKGLEPGDWIATAGVHSLKEGQQVRILDQE